MSTNIIALDHPVSLNGISLRFIPVRAPTRDDYNESIRMSLRKRDGEKTTLIRMLMPDVAKEDMQKAVGGFALLRQITGLPFSTLVQLEPDDQKKIQEFIKNSLQGGAGNG